MQTMHNNLKKLISELIVNGFKTINVESEVEAIYNQIVDAPTVELGHYAFPCFQFAKALKKAPPQIAAEICGKISHPDLTITAQGPYLNFFITNKLIGHEIVEEILNENFFKKQFLKKPLKVMYEYSQPNTHKELHVGHMRGLSLGNAFVRMDQYAGHNVMPVTYPGDMGTHVAKCLWYLKFHNKELAPTNPKDRGAWLGQIYSKANNILEDQVGTDLEEKNRKELTAIIQQLESRSGDYYQQWVETRQWSIDQMKDVYEWADVKFDHWFFESEVDGPSLELAKKLFNEGKLVKSEGAIGMDLSQEKLGFAMLIKSDGTGMYLTKDISLAYLKFEKYGIDQSNYVVDKRQAYHFQQAFKVLENIGFPHYQKCLHIQNGYVSLPDGAMSSRKGNIIPLKLFLSNMENLIKTKYLTRYQNDWSEQEINQTAKMIANGAIKYSMISVDATKDTIFDMEEALKLDGDTGPYLQYVHARIMSLCDKQNFNHNTKCDWQKLTMPQELSLMVKLSKFNDIAVSAALNHRIPLVTGYLYELGKLFNNFYAECSIARSENEDLKNARLGLSMAVALVMKKGLEILGIQAPLRM